MIGIELSVLKLLNDRLWMLAARYGSQEITVGLRYMKEGVID